MKTFRYFAYGSNMLNERLQARCPSARPIGIAIAPNHGLAFSKRGKDGSGKATLIPNKGPGDMVHGILFEIASVDLPTLDEAEGAGFGYDRFDDFTLNCGTEGSTLINGVTTYIAPPTYRDAALAPFDWYHALVLAGAAQHGLAHPYRDRLRTQVSVADPTRNRTGRLEAIRALTQAGIADYTTLF